MIRRIGRKFGLVIVAVTSVGLAVPAAASAASSVPSAPSISQQVTAPAQPAVPLFQAAPSYSQTLTVLGHTAQGSYGTLAMKAGSCSIYVDWSARYGSQNTGVLSEVWVKPYTDVCGGGGTLKFRAEMVCTKDSGTLVYYYGPWNNGAGNTSYIDQGNNCWEAVGTANGVPTIAAFQENMVNPTRVVCRNPISWINGRNVHGTNCGTVT